MTKQWPTEIYLTWLDAVDFGKQPIYSSYRTYTLAKEVTTPMKKSSKPPRLAKKPSPKKKG
jgi:hypothetical protein